MSEFVQTPSRDTDHSEARCVARHSRIWLRDDADQEIRTISTATDGIRSKSVLLSGTVVGTIRAQPLGPRRRGYGGQTQA
jgi:hypothetical protein